MQLRGFKLLKTNGGDREEKDSWGLWLCITRAHVSTQGGGRTTPFCSTQGVSTWLWSLPIKEIRLKRFQHERRPLKPTSGLLLPSNMRAKPHGLAVQASRGGKRSQAVLEWSMVSARARHQQGEAPVRACSDLHDSIICLPLYSFEKGCWSPLNYRRVSLSSCLLLTHCASESAPRSGLLSTLCHYEMESSRRHQSHQAPEAGVE